MVPTDSTALGGATIRISPSQVRRLARVLSDVVPMHPTGNLAWDDDRFWLTEASAADRSQFFAIGNALNFRFWTLSNGEVQASGGVLDGERFTGSMYMWRRLRLVLQRSEYDLLNADALAALTGPVLSQLLADDTGANPLDPAFGERLANLRDLGRSLRRVWNGKFHHLVEAVGEDLSAFYSASAKIRAYDDPVRKLATVNAIMHSGARLARFSQPLPVAIDYHVAKQLLRLGVIQVDDGLATQLTNNLLLSTAEGLSIRTACLEALGEVCELAGLSGESVDNFLWSNRRICTEPTPNCEACPIRLACSQLIEIQRPLELTRYY